MLIELQITTKLARKAWIVTIRCCRLDNEFENGPVGRWCDAHSIPREPMNPMHTIRMESLKRNNGPISRKNCTYDTRNVHLRTGLKDHLGERR